MKTLFRILSLSLSLASVYLVLTSKTGQDVVLAVACLAIAIVSACFMVVVEQREEIGKLRKGINAYQKSMEHSKGYSPSEEDLVLTGTSTLSEGSVMNMFKDRRGRRWFSIVKPEKF